jgi:hypothetical protein
VRESPSNPVEPMSTITTAVSPRSGRSSVDAVQRGPYDQAAVLAPAERRHPAEQRAVDLEAVTAREPVGAEPQRRHELHHAVQDEEHPDGPRLGAARQHELQPHEHEQRHRRRPVAECGQPPLRRRRPR